MITMFGALCGVLCSSACMGQSGLVADYTFSQGAGGTLRDATGNGNDGVIHGAKWVKAGTGHALVFNGKDSYVDCGPGVAPGPGPAASVEAWVRPYRRPSGEVGVVGKFFTSFLLTFYRTGNYYWYVGCGVAYVKLVPLSEDEAANFRAGKGNSSARRLAVTCDGSSFLAMYRPTTRREVLREVGLLRDAGIDTMLLHIGGSIQVSYATEVGEQYGRGMTGFPLVGSRYCVEACRELQKKGVNSTKAIIEGAHEIGMKVHVGFRPAIWGYYEPLDQFFRPKFFDDHPEWRTVDRDGTPVDRMSWAFPEVRKRQIDVLAEAVSFGADGAHIVFVRSWPVVLYEQPFIDAFKKQYGQDPRGADETDPRVFKLRSDIVTTFIREVRAMLDKQEKIRKDGKHLELSLCVMPNEYDNAQFGLDLRRLVDEHLLDELYPSYHPSFGGVNGTWDGKFFLDLCARDSIPVIPVYSSGVIKEENLPEWAKTTLSLHEQGFSGVGFWDLSIQLGFNKYRYLPLTRFGHTDELRALRENGVPGRVYAPIYILGDTVVDQRYLPTWGG